MEVNHTEHALVFKAFCDENRLMILKLLQDGEKCACRLLEELDIGQPTLSHHMKILCDSRVVEGRRCGRWTHYKISKDGGLRAAALLSEYIGTEPSDIQCCAQVPER